MYKVKGNLSLIEFSVSITIFLITCSSTIEGIINYFYPNILIAFSVLRYTTACHLLCYQYKQFKRPLYDKKFILFLIIYSLYILADISIFKKYPLGDMLSSPLSVPSYLLHCVYLFMLVLSSQTIINRFNIRLFIFLCIFFCLIPSLGYVTFVGVEVLQSYNLESQFVGNLTLAYNCMFVFLFIVFFYNQLFSVKFFNILLLLGILAGIGYVILICAKRGPILWSLVSMLVCLYANKRISYNNMVKFFIPVALLYIFGNTLLEMIKDIAPFTIEKIQDTLYSGDTSSRMSVDAGNSVYGMAINNFIDSPIYGNYFRLVSSDLFLKGIYPHNLFLEILITMGILGFIPMCYFLYKAFIFFLNRRNHHTSSSILAMFILFSGIFFELQTTGTICLNYLFWVSLSTILIISKFPFLK